MERESVSVIRGPMVGLTWLVAVGWAALGVASWLGIAPPSGWVLAGLGLVGAVGTGWLAWSLRVRHVPEGLRLPGRGVVPWEQVAAVEVEPGWLSVPRVVLRHGRALESVQLDGLAWFGGPDGTARRLAEKVARHAGVDVTVRPHASAGARRAA